MFVTAAVATVIGILSATVLPETHRKENRITEVHPAQMHPFKVIGDAFGRPALRSLLIGFTLITIPFAFFVNNFSVLALDTLKWGPTQVGLLTSGIGVTDIIIQGGLLGILIKVLGERGVVIAGTIGQLVGCLAIAAASAFLPSAWLFGSAALIFGAGQGGQTAAMEGMLSGAVGADEQGWLAGGISSIGSAVQMLAPLLAGGLYVAVSHSFPYWLGAVLIAVAVVVLYRPAHQPATPTPEPDALPSVP